MAKGIKLGKSKERPEKKFLDPVPAEYVFRCQDGSIFRDMRELAECLGTMSDDVFAYHANSTKNDFSNWVRDIIKDEKLASDLATATNRAQAARRAADRLAFLT